MLSPKFLIIVSAMLSSSSGEWFSSSSHVLSLLREESELLEHLRSYIDDEFLKLEFLNEMYFEMDKTSCINTENPRECMGNPTNQYTIMKHLAHTWKEISSVIANRNTSENFLWAHDRALPNLPTSVDVLGSMHGLIRIQTAYGLPATEISQGKVGESFHGSVLSAQDCFDISEAAYKNRNFAPCMDWALAARERVLQGDESIPLERVLYILARCSYDLQHLRFAYEAMRKVVTIAPNYMEVADFYRHIMQEATKHNLVSAQTDFSTSIAWYMQHRQESSPGIFEELCRKRDNYATFGASEQLRCYMWDGNKNPRLLLRPVKVEVESEQPFLVRFYDLVSDSECETLMEISNPLLTRAKVVGENGIGMESDYRVTKTVFLTNSSGSIINTVERRIGDVTGFDLRYAEDTSVSNYGIGGHYNVHLDAFGNRKDAEGEDRIATVLIYLSDVAQGGNTIFTRANIAVRPIKGSAVMWYNLHTNGSVDHSTLHAGCPVANGEKWIINKWIRQKAVSTCNPCSSNICPEPYMKMSFA